VPIAALIRIDKSASATNTIVIIFVHGWHHNAKVDDRNLIDFAEFPKQVRKKLHDVKDGISLSRITQETNRYR